MVLVGVRNGKMLGAGWCRKRGRVKSSARVLIFFLEVGYKEAEIWT